MFGVFSVGVFVLILGEGKTFKVQRSRFGKATMPEGRVWGRAGCGWRMSIVEILRGKRVDG